MQTLVSRKEESGFCRPPGGAAARPKMKKYKNYLMDMDGVLVRGATAIPSAQRFIDTLNERGIHYLVLTNDHIFTSAIATARFLERQLPNGKAFVIGESGLTDAIHHAGYVMTEANPDYVVLGETHGYNIAQVTKAIRLIARGARFVATNPDPSGPSEEGVVPACGAMAALIKEATGVSPFFVGKPNPSMRRSALNYLGAHSEETVMVGDRMDTDIVGAVSSGLDTVLVLTGVTRREEIGRFPYQPTYVLESIGDIEL